MKKIVILTFCLIFSQNSFGQDFRKIEAELVSHIQKINKWKSALDDGTSVSPWDSLRNENNLLKNKLLLYSTKYPTILTYDFQELKKENFFVATSEDKKFRIYSWDTHLGGESHYFENVFQFKTDKVYSYSKSDNRDKEDYGGYYSQIYSLDTNQRTIYLGLFNAIYSEIEGTKALVPFELEGNKLKDSLPLFKTKSGVVNKLGVDIDRVVLSQPEETMIKFDKKNRTIQMPIISKSGKSTPNYVSYQFTGQYFEKSKTN